MLEIRIEKQRILDNNTNRIINIPETTLQLEHSLISLKKWESKWHKAFLDKTNDKTKEEVLDYIRCMTINKGKIDSAIYYVLNSDDLEKVIKYIEDPMTASKFNDNLIGASKNPGEYITNETIYYWMISLGIPVEFQKWHLSQLLTLIKFVSIKNAPKKKMSKKEAAQQRAILNAQRRAQYNTRG